MAYYGIGSIIGDIIGSHRERNNEKYTNFEWLIPECRMTDDSILTIATMDAIISNPSDPQYSDKYREYFRLYPDAGFGKKFKAWGFSDSDEIIDSCGNGSAMRVSPIGLVYPTLESTLYHAHKSAKITHSHPEGLKGAKAIAGAVYLASMENSKEAIKNWITTEIGYDLNFTIDGIRDSYERNVTCQGSVPQAIVAFLDADDFESTIRLAISLGGDSDTIAAMAGGIAEVFYGIPESVFNTILPIIDANSNVVLSEVIRKFDNIYG